MRREKRTATPTLRVLTVLTASALALALALPLSSQAAGSASAPAKPSASTGSVGRVTGSSATLEGSVNPHTLTTTYYFKYGPTVTYGQQTTPATVQGSPSTIDTVKISQTATGLAAGYHYRLVATNADGTSEGHDRLFIVKTKKTKSAFVLPKSYAPIPLGSTFALSGTLTGTTRAGREVVLQATPYPYTAPFANVGAPVVTSPAGSFSFRVTAMSTSTRFRVETVGAPSVVSPIVPAAVSVRVVLRVRSAPAGKGLVRLYGTVTPAETGAHVYLQLEKQAKAKLGNPEKPEKLGKTGPSEAEERAPRFVTRFSTLVKHATRSISRFSIVVSIRDTGHYRAFVDVRPGPLASGTSPSILLHAAAKKKSRKKG